tara:strand:+ start:646 stop:810 length:165 start_codon:yes stop_codon:yes gene_type:complete
MLDGAKAIIGDKVQVIGQEYYNNSYDVIIDIKGNKFIIDDGCEYKSTELIEYKK